jgi:hypothetical protein
MSMGLKTLWGCVFGVAAAGVLALLYASCSSESNANSTGNKTERPVASRAKGREKAGPGAFEGDFEKIRIEAESAEKIEGEIMRIVADPLASGGKCLEIPDKIGKPEDGKLARARYRFKVAKAGTYYVWARRFWIDQCGDTFAIRFDKVGRPHNDAIVFGADDASKPPRWGWTPVRENGRPRPYIFTAGEHVMEILNTEDGPRLDLVLLTDDSSYVPTDSEEMPGAR